MLDRNLRKKFQYYKTFEVIFTKRAKIRISQRNIGKDLVLKHINNLDCVNLVEKLEFENLEKYKVWFFLQITLFTNML